MSFTPTSAGRPGGDPPELTVTSKTLEEHVLLFTVSGEMDAATAPTLAAALESAASLRPQFILMDLSGVTFMDSTGIRLLLDADQQARAMMARLRICGASRAVRRPLELTGTLELLEIHETPADALADIPPR
jgi:anti-anti-sigma factor